MSRFLLQEGNHSIVRFNPVSRFGSIRLRFRSRDITPGRKEGKGSAACECDKRCPRLGILIAVPEGIYLNYARSWADPPERRWASGAPFPGLSCLDLTLTACVKKATRPRINKPPPETAKEK